DLISGTAQACPNDANGVIRAEPTSLETLCQRKHILAAKSLFELGKGSKGQAQLPGLAIQARLDFSSMPICHLEPPLHRGETQFPRRFESQIKGNFTVVASR